MAIASNNVLQMPDRRAAKRPPIDPAELEVARLNTEQSCQHDREQIRRLVEREYRQQRIQHWAGIVGVSLLILAGLLLLWSRIAP